MKRRLALFMIPVLLGAIGMGLLVDTITSVPVPRSIPTRYVSKGPVGLGAGLVTFSVGLVIAIKIASKGQKGDKAT